MSILPSNPWNDNHHFLKFIIKITTAYHNFENRPLFPKQKHPQCGINPHFAGVVRSYRHLSEQAVHHDSPE
jgi:hypothetical protein